MNRIKTTYIVDPSIQQPLTGRSLDFLQDANKSIALGLGQALVGETYDITKAYILKGLDAYGTNQYHAGYVLWNGEIYYSPGKTTTTAFSNIPVMTITVANDAIADPLTFTDNVPRNVHNIITLVLSDALTGSGTFDLTDAIYLHKGIVYTPTLSASDSATSPVVGGFTGTATASRYSVKGNLLSLYIKVTGVATLSNARYLQFTLPDGITPFGNRFASGSASCLYYNGSTYFPTIAIMEASYTGSGIGLSLVKTDFTDFGAFTGGSFYFKIDITMF